MRVIRYLLLAGVVIAVVGCAQQRVVYVAYPPATPAAPAAATSIDHVVYGAATTPAPAPAPGPYAVAPGGSYVMAPNAVPPAAAPSYGRGLYGYAASSGSAAYAYAPPAPEGHYTLDSGDRLRIVVFGQDGLTNSYLVSAGGNIDMPLIGSVAARGLSTDQLASRISEKLRDGFIREPHVAVEIESYRPFFILGEITQPGQYPYVANMTAETAVAIAGGFSPRAFRNSVILNRNYYGRQIRMSVPLTFPLRPGDTINVQERWF